MIEQFSDSEPIMPIGVVARKLDVSVSTVRLYEKEGLLYASRSQSGRRLYSLNDLFVASKIKRLIREHGLNFAGVRAFLSTIPCWNLRRCPEEVRPLCTAYSGQLAPCWSPETVGCIRKEAGCSSCEVYLAVAQTPLDRMGDLMRR
jgi:MerR family transcriptional regulator/heat shock protein HspR